MLLLVFFSALIGRERLRCLSRLLSSFARSSRSSRCHDVRVAVAQRSLIAQVRREPSTLSLDYRERQNSFVEYSLLHAGASLSTFMKEAVNMMPTHPLQCVGSRAPQRRLIRYHEHTILMPLRLLYNDPSATSTASQPPSLVHTKPSILKRTSLFQTLKPFHHTN